VFARTDDQLLLFGNTNGHGVVEERQVDLGGSWQPRTWTQEIITAQRVDSNTWLVALADGGVERFTYSNASSLNIAQVPGIRDMALDPLSGLMYLAAGSQVIAVNSQTGQTAATYPIGGEVRYVLPFFNRQP
ncbi:MAG TPA: hypothetical protein VHL57_07330, partial [Flavobacteriales bacterium]|jgi:hypothetical protein|nr:hypothetical protein [Flavobacteriales bacterium]